MSDEGGGNLLRRMMVCTATEGTANRVYVGLRYQNIVLGKGLV